MGNTFVKEKSATMPNKMSEKTHEYYYSTHINSSDVKRIRDPNNYTVINVDYFFPESSMKKIEPSIIVSDLDKVYSTSKPSQTSMAYDMMDFCFKDESDQHYQRVDYVCNEQEGVCICNTHADDFRKIYDGQDYKSGRVNIIWVKKKNQRF